MCEKLADALDYIRDSFLTEAADAKKQKRRPYWLGALAAVLALVLLVTTAGGPAAASAAGLVAAPSYPEMSPYPDEMSFFSDATGEFDQESFDKVYTAWWEDQLAQQNQPEGYADGLSAFFAAGMPEFLNSGEENAVCSPLNIYLALAMLAETSGGNSRQQILDLLNANSLESLRTQAGQVWNAHYCADTATTTLLANSLWLNGGLSYNSSTVKTLTESYYASVYQGQLGSDEMNQALRDWLNTQTGGLLEDQIQNTEMNAETLLALASAISYRAKWHEQFLSTNNTEGVFHSPAGDTAATFLNRTLFYGPYYWGEDFAAAYLTLEDSSKMWLILPDEGKTPQDILSSGLALDMILNHSSDYENQTSIKVHLSLPKFDISADLQLKSCLQDLGITDVFSETAADFTPILPEDTAWLDSVQHAARVAIDEEGVTAAAYTVMQWAGATMPPEDEVYFTLDRPFLFVITSRDNLPLFAGIVNTP